MHKSLYQQFVDGAVELVKQYKLGDPFDAATTMGPVAQPFVHSSFHSISSLDSIAYSCTIECDEHQDAL